MKKQCRRFLSVFGMTGIIFQLFFFIPVKAQQQTEIKVSVAIIGSLRYMQNISDDAAEIMQEVIARKHNNHYTSKPFSQYNLYEKTSIDFGKKTLFLQEDYSSISEDHRKNLKDNRIHTSRNTGFLKIVGQQNILLLLDEAFGDIDLYQNDTELMQLNFKTPLADDASKTYQYLILGFKNIDGNDCYEIAFFAKNPKDNAFAGYLYVDTSSLVLRKAVFTLNNPDNINFLKNILITHTYTKSDDVMCPVKKESAIALGDEFDKGLTIIRTLLYSDFDFGDMGKKSWGTTYDADFQKVEPGPLLQFISYNDMEGLRLRVGGNTTPALMNRFQIGGYLAYGMKDKGWKYRGDLIYSFHPRDKYIWEFPKKLLSFTYINDLNIPGQDLLTTNRDNLIYSFSQKATNNMSLQKIGLLTFENENKYNFAYSIGAKYTSDEPVGVVKYMKVSETGTHIVNSLNTTELNLSLRYAPRERFFQNRDKRIPIRKGIIELQINHRLGIKGILGSDYNYQITNAGVYKKISLGNTLGNLDLQISGGKVWNKVPFPLLFIPVGNQSYIYQTENFNCMNFYEFTTDRFVAGNLNFLFNWSPVNLLYKDNRVKTNLGGRAIYGPLSHKNNPALHPELFVFNEGVTPLGQTPYIEVNAGLSNIFKILRIEYAHRLTYINNNRNNGSLLVSGSFSF